MKRVALLIGITVLVVGYLLVFWPGRLPQHVEVTGNRVPPYGTPAQFRGGVCDLVAVDQQCLKGDVP